MSDLKIRISGDDHARETALAALRSALTVTSVSAPYPNRNDPGARVYVEADLPAAAPDSPLSQATDAKRRRDLGAEIEILTAAGRDLESQPWMPLQPGDVVLTYQPDSGLTYAKLSETYLAVDDGFGWIELRQVAASYTNEMSAAVDLHASASQAEAPTCSIDDLWFEWGPATITVIRAGTVVYGNPAKAV